MNRKKKAAKKKVAKQKPGPKPVSTPSLNGSPINNSFEPFEIITDAPEPRNGVNFAVQAVRSRIDTTMGIVKPGQSFIIPLKNRGAVTSYLKKNWSAERFTLSRVLNNDSVMRVYWHPPKPKK